MFRLLIVFHEISHCNMYIHVYYIFMIQPHFIVPYKSQFITSVIYIYTTNLSVTFYRTSNIFQSLSKDQLFQAITCSTLTKITIIALSLYLYLSIYLYIYLFTLCNTCKLINFGHMNYFVFQIYEYVSVRFIWSHNLLSFLLFPCNSPPPPQPHPHYTQSKHSDTVNVFWNPKTRMVDFVHLKKNHTTSLLVKEIYSSRN